MKARALAFAFLVASGTNVSAAGTETALGAFAVRTVPRGWAGLALAPARALAVERLGRAACREIFEELSDFTGRPVARRLEEGERSPSSHFSRLSFVESSDGPCAQGSVAAWSVAGDVHVHLCRRTFLETAWRDRHEAAAILIHEALHTLGVKETAAPEPLTSYVRRRCGL